MADLQKILHSHETKGSNKPSIGKPLKDSFSLKIFQKFTYPQSLDLREESKGKKTKICFFFNPQIPLI